MRGINHDIHNINNRTRNNVPFGSRAYRAGRMGTETQKIGGSVKYREIFKVDTMENFGENWLIASFGVDNEDGKEYILTSNYMKADEIACYSEGAKADAELVARLLNAYFNGQIKFKM